MLKNEYKMLRKSDGKQSTSYRYTVRQLESLIRLSEAMARLHADPKIRASYVREVCRLLKASNINIMKNDFEFEENQDAINEEREEVKQKISLGEEAQNDLFVSIKSKTNFFLKGTGCTEKTHREPELGFIDAVTGTRDEENQNYLRGVSEDRIHGRLGDPRFQIGG